MFLKHDILNVTITSRYERARFRKSWSSRMRRSLSSKVISDGATYYFATIRSVHLFYLSWNSRSINWRSSVQASWITRALDWVLRYMCPALTPELILNSVKVALPIDKFPVKVGNVINPACRSLWCGSPSFFNDPIYTAVENQRYRFCQQLTKTRENLHIYIDF